MFSKINLKHILILALGFFFCSSIYLTQEQYLFDKCSDENFVNIVELLFGSFSMAIGILLFGIMCKKNKKTKLFYLIFNILALISGIVFFITKNTYVMSICMCLTCLFGTAGFGAGYHFSLLSKNVDTKYRGTIFAIGYGLGNIGTYLLITLPEKFYSTALSLIFYIPVFLIFLFLVMKEEKFSIIKENKKEISIKSYFIKMSIIMLSMSLLSALSTDAIGYFTINLSGGYGNTRLYYCLGLLIAGILCDKKKNIFDILIISSFIFSLLSVILLKENYSINIVAALSYFFVGFFVIFRTITFVNMVDKKSNMIYASAFGLMYSRIMEGLMVLFEDQLINNFTLLIIITCIMLSIVITLFLTIYFSNNTNDDMIKNISVKYKLSNQEEKILELLINNNSNQEIADKLYVSISTVKNHITSIYKKTGMNKKQLKEKIYLK